MNGTANTFCGLTQSEVVELKVLNDKFCQGAAAFVLTPDIEASPEYKRMNALMLKKMKWHQSQLN
jgi:hypothetical protein